MSNALHDELNRVSAAWPVATSAKVSNWSRQKLGEVAQAQSRRVLAEARAELMQRAMRRFLALVYDGAPHVWYNVSGTGRIVVPVPWSRRQHAAYGLTDPDSRVLRVHVVDVVASLPGRRSLLWYDDAAGFWHLNRGGFPELAQALNWLDGPGRMTAARYMAIASTQDRRGRNGGRR
jgi:hypothetical protein